VSAPHTPLDAHPRVIGRYRIETHLDADAMDDVYRGFDPLIERPVVVKVFALDLASEDAERTVKDVFYREMRRVGALVHENIATLFDAGELPGALFMASEFVDGMSLAAWLAGETAPLDLAVRASVVAQMTDALEQARDMGAVHLRLRPTNVLVSPDLSVKVSGFGVAAVVEAIVRASGTAGPALTPYDAPERSRLPGGDGRADVFSLARIGLDVIGWSAAAPAGRPVDLDAPRPAWWDAHAVDAVRLREAFVRALSADPADRAASAGDFRRDLFRALGVAETEARLAWMLSAAGGLSDAEAGASSDATSSAEAVAAMFADTQTVRVDATTAGRPRDETLDTMMAVTSLPPTPDPPGEAVTVAHGDQDTMLAPRPDDPSDGGTR
jgi:serine/threonine-protein kinase